MGEQEYEIIKDLEYGYNIWKVTPQEDNEFMAKALSWGHVIRQIEFYETGPVFVGTLKELKEWKA